MTRHSRQIIGALGALLLAGALVLALSVFRGSAPDTPPAIDQGAQGELERAQQAVRQSPDDPSALAALAEASLGRARESGDPTWYDRAEEAARRAMASDPRSFEALDAMAGLSLVRHRFADALDYADRSLAAAPDRFAPHGLRGDALIELGRYPEAFRAVARRLELRPDLPSYSRASYVQELQGDREGAASLMELAVDAGAPGSESRVWTRVQLGLLRLGSGQIARAEREMRLALAERPADARALAGLARVRAAQGRLADAAELYGRAIDILPLPEHPAALADVETARGRPGAAREALAVVRALISLQAENGVRTDLDLALIEADLTTPGLAAVGRARTARATRPGVVGDQVLGWVLTRAGRCAEGLRYARLSLRLGARDALALFHAGMAASCAGRREEASGLLRRALDLNPRFSVRWSAVARRTLRGLR